MTFKQALRIVLDLAAQNALQEGDTFGSQELIEESRRQHDALDQVFAFITTLADDAA